MAKFTLTIDTDELTELHMLVARMANTAPVDVATASPIRYETEPLALAPAGAKPAASKQRAKPAEEAKAAAPEPTIGSETPSPTASASSETASASTPATSTPASPPSTPSSAPSDPVPPTSQLSSPAVGGGVTYEDVKAALSKLMEAKGAKFAQETLKKSVGFGSLSTTPPDKYADALAAIQNGLVSDA